MGFKEYFNKKLNEEKVKSYKHKFLPLVIDAVESKDHYLLISKTYPKTVEIYNMDKLKNILKTKYDTSFDEFIEQN